MMNKLKKKKEKKRKNNCKLQLQALASPASLHVIKQILNVYLTTAAMCASVCVTVMCVHNGCCFPRFCSIQGGTRERNRKREKSKNSFIAQC